MRSINWCHFQWPWTNYNPVFKVWMGYRMVKKSSQDVQPFWYRASVWQTDRETDRRTDVQPISITCVSIADARKKDTSRFQCRSRQAATHEDSRVDDNSSWRRTHSSDIDDEITIQTLTKTVQNCLFWLLKWIIHDEIRCRITYE